MKLFMKLWVQYSRLLLAGILLTALTGCRQNTTAQKHIIIGVSYQNLQDEYIIYLQRAIRSEAKKLHVGLIELDAQGNAVNQISHVQDFVARGVNAIILNPADEQGSAPAVALAVQDHIPIVVVNTLVSNVKEANAYVGSPDIEAGRMEATEIIKRLHGRGNIAVIQGPYGSSAELQRTKGIRQVIAKFPGAKIVVEQTANWSRVQALALMENWLSAGRRINAVIAENDDMALGAEEAIQAAGKGKQIIVIGVDGIPDALRAVAEGKLAATVSQNAHAQGTLAVKLAVRLAEGHKVRHTNYIPFRLVTARNVKEFLSSK